MQPTVFTLSEYDIGVYSHRTLEQVARLQVEAWSGESARHSAVGQAAQNIQELSTAAGLFACVLSSTPLHTL
jgi:hypothetical protein